MVIYNTGRAALQIDSIKCNNWNYALNVGPNKDQNEWKILEEFVYPENRIEINPIDSLKLQLSLAAVLPKESRSNYNQIDTMYFYNNSINAPIQSISISNKVIMGDVEEENIPVVYKLFQNYPNPFNPSTKISFSLYRSSMVLLKVYDNLGREIIEFIHGYHSFGNYYVNFDGSEFSSGVYYYQLIVGSNRTTKKMLLLK